MTTAMCYRPPQTPSGTALRALSLPILDTPHANPNPSSATITGPRTIAAVKMLRISVTDVCNLRCLYCMPEEGVEWLPKSSLLTYEEIAAIVRAAVDLGLTHFKLTGGEPTARRDLPTLVQLIRRIPGVRDLSLTTNGILLAPLLENLRSAGLNRLTISLDSLRPDRFAQITRGGNFHKVWAAIEKALTLHFSRIKLNVVVMHGINESEIPDFAELTRQLPLTVRFIEYMPLGRSAFTDHPEAALISESQIRSAIESRHGPLYPADRQAEPGVGPANLWALPNAPGKIGFISAVSHPFCESCNRLRLTPDGLLRSCLYDGGEIDLKPLLRRHPNDPATAQSEILADSSNLQSTHSLLLQAFTSCVTLKPQTHSHHGNKPMNQIGG